MTDVTICITMGLRPVELRRTLNSIQSLTKIFPILAVNDFGDEETNGVFRELCPTGQLVDLGGKVGHHAAVDAMYAKVETPFVLHLEDDWEFHRTDFVSDALQLLARDPATTGVCVRDISDFPFTQEKAEMISIENVDGISFARLTNLHKKWFGFTFNPHISRISSWETLGGFGRFKREKDVSNYCRKRGLSTAFLVPGACGHIGVDSVSQPQGRSISSRLRSLIGRSKPE